MPETIEWRGRRPGRRQFLVLVILVAVLIIASRTAISYYVELLWFGSLGYGAVFRKTLSLQCTVFALFFAATFFIVHGWFLVLRRTYQPDLLNGGLIFIGRQPIRLPVERILSAIVLAVSLLIAAGAGAGM